MKTKIALLLVSLPLLAYGGEQLYHVYRNPQQTTLTCDQLAQQHPSARWIRVTGCELDYMNAAFPQSGGRITEILFPVRAVGRPLTEPAALVATTRDPDVLAVAQNAIAGATPADQEAYLVAMLRIVTMLKASREVEGYARTGVVERALAARAMATLKTPAAPGYILLDLHTRPRVLVPAVIAWTGIVLLAIGLFATRRRRVPAAVDVAVGEPASIVPMAEAPVPDAVALDAAPAGVVAVTVPAVVEVPAPLSTLPTMMLLNIPTSAGLDAIEHAPALGSRSDVIAILAGALPGIEFDEGGHGVAEQPDASLTIELGPSEPVWTATVKVRGPGATQAIAALSRATTWRVYIPKHGAFVEADVPEPEEVIPG
jgi:hypothetical protein